MESVQVVGEQAGCQPEDISECKTIAVEVLNELKHKPDFSARVVFL